MVSTVPQCCKNVWVLLTGTSLLKSKEYIGSILETNAPKLVNGLLYYNTCKVKDVNEVKQILSEKHIDEVSPEFLYKLSTLLNVEPLQSYELFLSFLLHDYKGTPKSIKNYFNSEKSIQSLLNLLWEFYCSERLFALFSMKQILSNWQHSSKHPYKQLFRDFLMSEKVKSVVFSQLIAQFKYSISSEFPNRGSNSEGKYDKWLENSVKEELELLQLMLLYFNEIEPNIDNVLELIDLFRAHGFGARPLFDRSLHIAKNSNIESYLKFIGFLESMVIIECLKLDSLCKCMESESHEHFLLKLPEKLKKLDDIIQSLPVSTQPCSIIFFAWSFVRSWELPELVSSPALIKHFGMTALNLKVFDYTKQSVTSSFFENFKGTVVESVLKFALSNLFSSMFSIFGLAMAENSMNAIYEIGKCIMDDEVIADKVLDRGLDNGLQLLLSKSAEEFPLKIKNFLDLCISLVQTESFDALINELSNMNSLCEWVDRQEVDLTPTENSTMFILASDRFLFKDRRLLIRSNTTAKLLKQKDQRFLIQWQNISIDGFSIFAHIFEERLLLIKKGYYNSLNADAIEELCLITDLVTELLDYGPDYYRDVASIVQLCFDGFRLFTRFPQIPRKLIVSFLELFSLLTSSDQHSEVIWEIINERGFFPYMIGLTKDKTAIINGQDTNASKIGEIIVFEECVVGEYQLCCAYLKFLCSSCPTKRNCLLPALIHVITEIFPSFHRWHYKRNKDFENIGHLCLELFQKVLCFDTPDEDWKNIIDVCKSSLLNSASGQTLLELIISGETVAKQVIETLGSDVALVEHHLIVMIRQSLSVLNRLLFLQAIEKNEKFVASAVEQSLFSTNASKPNMILVLSHYVFQNYDSRLATLAATLMKRLSKHFPMSLLACLGSEAESVKDHFLFKLQAVTEDLRLKVSLLDFLSSCIKHQPGLIEMFLNVDTADEAATTETSSCLKTVLEMLEEKMTGKFFCPKELHCAAVKFLYTFWLQSHLLAINSLKKTSNLWKLICFPFLNEKGTFNDKVCGYIWRILAREIFFIKVLERGEFEPSFVELFDGLKQNDCLSQMSRVIFTCCSQQEDQEKDVDASFLLASWRDFLLSVSKFTPFEVSIETKRAIVADIVTSLSIQLGFKEKPNHTLLLHLSDILLLLLKKWGKEAIRSMEDWIKIKTDILYATNEQQELLTIGFHTSINILMCQTFKMCYESESWVRENLKDCFLPWCGLFKYSLRILEKQISYGKCENELKLTMTSLTAFQHLFSTLPDVMVLSQNMRNNLIIESFCTVLCTLIRQNIGLRLAESIISIFVQLSTSTPMADLLQLTKVLEDISTSLQNSYKSMTLMSSHSDFSWLKFFTKTLKLATSLLLTLRYHYAEVAVSFVITHLHVMEHCLAEVRHNPSVEAINVAKDIMTFLCALVDFRVVWIMKHKNSYEKLWSEISKTCHSVIAFLIRPNLLQYVLTHPSSTRNLTSTSASQISLAFPSRNVNTDEDSNKLLKRSISLENESQSELNPDIQQSFLQLLAYTLQFLQSVNPPLMDVLYVKRETESTKMQLHPSFSTPNIDPDNVTSFGSLLYCLSFCVRFIQKIEKESSTGEVSNDVNVMKNRLPFILETSLSLVVTNAILAQNCQSLKERERQMIRRELKNELNSILISRQPKRNLSGSNIAAAPRSPVNTLLDRPFVKQLLEIIEKD